MKNINPIKVTKLINSGVSKLTTLNNAVVKEKIVVYTLNRGFFAFALKFDATTHADARLTVGYKVSSNGIDFITSESGSEIKVGMHKAGGEDSDGLYHIQFYIPLCKVIELSITETASQDAVFEAWLLTQ